MKKEVVLVLVILLGALLFINNSTTGQAVYPSFRYPTYNQLSQLTPTLSENPQIITEIQERPPIEPEPESCQPPTTSQTQTFTGNGAAAYWNFNKKHKPPSWPENAQYDDYERTGNCPPSNNMARDVACQRAQNNCLSNAGAATGATIINAISICQKACAQYKKNGKVCKPFNNPLTISPQTSYSSNNCQQTGTKKTPGPNGGVDCESTATYTCSITLTCNCDP